MTYDLPSVERRRWARTIASWWHGGQTSGLYSFASTGEIREEALAEIRREILDAPRSHMSSESLAELCWLLGWLIEAGTIAGRWTGGRWAGPPWAEIQLYGGEDRPSFWPWPTDPDAETLL